jgi:beta-lactamase class D
MKYILLCALLGAVILNAPPAQAKPVCTILLEARSAQVLTASGECDSRVTPASTFKMALSLMGFDAGILESPERPRFDFLDGYLDWGGENWRVTTDPHRWMKYSVVWYSRKITQSLGHERLSRYAAGMGYGNADFAGDYGQSNGLERAWMTSSLSISPREQAVFVSRLIGYDLPVSANAIDQTKNIVAFDDTPHGWRVHGKTGTAYPRMDSGSFDYAKGWGWFVGWATREGQTITFAHLLQDEARHTVSPGLRAKAALLSRFDTLAQRAVE